MRPILYASSTCGPCLEVFTWIAENAADVDIRWVRPAMNPVTAARFYRLTATGAEIHDLRGVPTLFNGDARIEGAPAIIACLTAEHNTI